MSIVTNKATDLLTAQLTHYAIKFLANKCKWSVDEDFLSEEYDSGVYLKVEDESGIDHCLHNFIDDDGDLALELIEINDGEPKSVSFIKQKDYNDSVSYKAAFTHLLNCMHNNNGI